MSKLFEPVRLGQVELANRIMHSATMESMADAEGHVTDRHLERYRALAASGVGLIVPGTLHVNDAGRFGMYSAAISDDRFMPGLSRLVDAVHRNGSRIAFQIQHAGRQTFRRVTGQRCVAPSKGRLDPMFMARPRVMSPGEIESTVEDYARAAERAFEVGVDGLQLHAGHGFLVNQFLSPFFNRRTDEWGGSDENRFRFVRRVFERWLEKKPDSVFLMAKLSVNDFTPRAGINPELAARYSGWLHEMGVDCVETTCGTGSFSNMNIWRGDIPIREMVRALPPIKRPAGWLVIRRMVGRFDWEEGYNLEAARTIRAAVPGLKLSLVGGLRHREFMERVLEDGSVDLVSMSRPFIRRIDLVEDLRRGAGRVSCVNCNRCLATTVGNQPIRCSFE